MTLAHPTITLAQLQALRSSNPHSTTISPATLIDLAGPSAQHPYQLVWVTQPNGNTGLYRLIPDPPDSSPGSSPLQTKDPIP